MANGNKKNGWKNEVFEKSQTGTSLFLICSFAKMTENKWLKTLPIRSSLSAFGILITLFIVQENNTNIYRRISNYGIPVNSLL